MRRRRYGRRSYRTNRGAGRAYRTKYSRKHRSTVAYFKEKYMSTQIGTNGAVTSAVSLNEIASAQLTAYQALYRSFKIMAVKLTFLMDYGGWEYNQAVQNANDPITFTGVNRLSLIPQTSRDLVAPTSEADALESNNVRMHTFTTARPKSFYFKAPHFVNDVEGATEYTFKTGWLSTNAGADIDHNVAAWWMQAEGTGSNPYHVLTTLYFKCKDPI